MLTYVPGDSFAHRLDPRTKLGFQIAFAVAGFAHTTTPGLVVLTGVVGVALVAARTPPVAALREFRLALVLLAIAPVLEGLRLDAPWFSVEEATAPAMASYRVVLLLLVSAIYLTIALLAMRFREYATAEQNQ